MRLIEYVHPSPCYVYHAVIIVVLVVVAGELASLNTIMIVLTIDC